MNTRLGVLLISAFLLFSWISVVAVSAETVVPSSSGSGGGSVSSNNCTDTDGGINYYVGGTAGSPLNGVYTDFCYTLGGIPENSKNYSGKGLREYSCDSSGSVLGEDHTTCPNGCKDGKCYYPGFNMKTDKSSYGNGDIVKLLISSADGGTANVDLYLTSSTSEKKIGFSLIVKGSLTTEIKLGEHPALITKSGTYGLLICDAGTECIGGTNTNSMTIEISVPQTSPTMPTDMDSCLNNPNYYWDQRTDSCLSSYPGCVDPDDGKNIFEQAHTFGLRSSYADSRDKRIITGGKDACVSDKQIIEHYCDNNFIQTVYLDCPNGCSDGACIKGEEVKEQVTCIFQNSDVEQKCYTAGENDRAYCSGVGSCVAYIKGYKGEQITWKSSCGQYQYTIMDGNNEKVGFECSGKTVCQDSDNGKDIYQKGTTSGLDWGTSNVVSKTDYCISEGEKAGRLAEYFCDYANGVSMVASQTFGVEDGCYGCSDGRCEQIIVKPVCGNGICESGEGDVCTCPVISAECKEGKECKVPACVCNVNCPQDCKQTEGIYANLNEKFKLQVYQPVKITEGENHLMKITFKDLIAYKCENMEISSSVVETIKNKVASAERAITGRVVSSIASSETTSTTTTTSSSSSGSSGGGGGGAATPPIASTPILKCVGAGPKALLDVDMIVNSELGNHLILNLDVGEKKQIKEFTISFLSYDYASRTGVFLVSRETFSCEKGCKCDENGKVIECAGEACKKGETLCPDGVCREKCGMISEDCKYGCLYEGKCFPMGVRSSGLYCSDSSIMDSQRGADEKCDNNFECTSNVCVNSKCISEGFLQKIMNWFSKLFGG